MRPVRDGELRIELKVEPAGNRGSFRAGFTLCVLGEELVTRAGRRVKLGDEPFELAGAELGGGFRLGPLALEGPPGMSVHWPYKPFNSYHAEGLCTRGAWLLRVAVELPFERPAAGFTLRVE
ncbi:MAG: hypothetical protein M5U26_01265 [Planctomycetota bacterium]|nr:hypothetical protein [Planctomycetota bacterium]